jgi:hypothetical protein
MRLCPVCCSVIAVPRKGGGGRGLVWTIRLLGKAPAIRKDRRTCLKFSPTEFGRREEKRETSCRGGWALCRLLFGVGRGQRTLPVLRLVELRRRDRSSRFPLWLPGRDFFTSFPTSSALLRHNHQLCIKDKARILHLTFNLAQSHCLFPPSL